MRRIGTGYSRPSFNSFSSKRDCQTEESLVILKSLSVIIYCMSSQELKEKGPNDLSAHLYETPQLTETKVALPQSPTIIETPVTELEKPKPELGKVYKCRFSRHAEGRYGGRSIVTSEEGFEILLPHSIYTKRPISIRVTRLGDHGYHFGEIVKK
jgi:hypothetical protein